MGDRPSTNGSTGQPPSPGHVTLRPVRRMRHEDGTDRPVLVVPLPPGSIAVSAAALDVGARAAWVLLDEVA